MLRYDKLNDHCFSRGKLGHEKKDCKERKLMAVYAHERLRKKWQQGHGMTVKKSGTDKDFCPTQNSVTEEQNKEVKAMEEKEGFDDQGGTWDYPRPTGRPQEVTSFGPHKWRSTRRKEFKVVEKSLLAESGLARVNTDNKEGEEPWKVNTGDT